MALAPLLVLSFAALLALQGEPVLPRKLLGTWLEERRRTDPNLVLRPRHQEILRLASERLSEKGVLGIDSLL